MASSGTASAVAGTKRATAAAPAGTALTAEDAASAARGLKEQASIRAVSAAMRIGDKCGAFRSGVASILATESLNVRLFGIRMILVL
jgi:hypothetical protein